MHLELSGATPSFIFKGDQLQLIASLPHSLTHDIPLQVTAHVEGNPHSLLPPSAYEVLNPEALVVRTSTRSSPTIHVRLPESSGLSSVVIQLSAVGEFSSRITPVATTPMRVVVYRLEICNESELQALWYKDGPGGKKNQLTLTLRLVDSTGNPIYKPGLRLQLQLYYEDGSKVAKQSILKIQPGQNMFLGSDGCATIKYRIESCSKNHGHKMFYVGISPDYAHDPTINDISHPRSPSVLVKSKITEENLEKKLRKHSEVEEKSRQIGDEMLCPGSKRRRMNDNDTDTDSECCLHNYPNEHCSIASHKNYDDLVGFVYKTADSLQLLKANIGDARQLDIVNQMLHSCESLGLPVSSSFQSLLFTPPRAASHLMEFEQVGHLSLRPDPLTTKPNGVIPFDCSYSEGSGRNSSSFTVDNMPTQHKHKVLAEDNILPWLAPSREVSISLKDWDEMLDIMDNSSDDIIADIMDNSSDDIIADASQSHTI